MPDLRDALSHLDYTNFAKFCCTRDLWVKPNNILIARELLSIYTRTIHILKCVLRLCLHVRSAIRNRGPLLMVVGFERTPQIPPGYGHVVLEYLLMVL